MPKNYLPMFDFISPKITLFYEGNKRYSSTIGGIFTIIICCVGIYAFIDQILSYINFNINNIQYYRKILNESDAYIFNNDKNSIFFYINILKSVKTSVDIDLSKIRMVGLFSTSVNIRESSYFERDHWLFGKCDSFNIDEELQNLAKNDLNKSMCLKFFYNTKAKKYYSIDNKNYQFPNIVSTKHFNIFIYKCINNSITNQIYGDCSPENEVIKYLENNAFVMKYSYLSHQINSDNTKNPDQLSINSIVSRVQMKDTFSTNSIIFTPLMIERDTGLFFINKHVGKTYSYSASKKSTENNSSTKDILNFFTITIENVAHYYKCTYKTIYDGFTRITIFIQVAHYILFAINYIINLFAANINIQNIIFHKKILDKSKTCQFFSNNYAFNLANGRLKNIEKKKTNDILQIRMIKNTFSEENNFSNQGSSMMLQENLNRIKRLNNHNIKSVCKKIGDYKTTQEKIFGKIKLSPKDILLFFKYLICKNWNNSPLLLFDSIQKKLISVEHLLQIHLLLLSFKKQRNENNLDDIYKFFYE